MRPSWPCRTDLLFDKGNGSTYPLTQLLTSDLTLNETAYQELGTPHAGAHFLWTVFFDYAAYSSALIWMVLFGYEKLRASASRLWSRRKKGAPALSEQFNDQLSILQRSYPEVPLWWYLALFTASFVVILAVTASGSMFIPVWTFIVAIATGAVIVVPLGWLYALSNYQLVRHVHLEYQFSLRYSYANTYEPPSPLAPPTNCFMASWSMPLTAIRTPAVHPPTGPLLVMRGTEPNYNFRT